MRNPIENLGDYNEVREDLQAAGGCKETLYNSIGETAVSKATPKLLLVGGLIATGLISIVHFGNKGIKFIKERKRKIENEPALKKEFFETIQVASSKRSNEELKDCEEINKKGDDLYVR